MVSAVSVSVRSLVEFILRSGDIDNRIPAAPDDAMIEGSRMHRRLQKASGPDYEPEVSLSCIYTYPDNPDLRVKVEGRADGIYHGTLPDDPHGERGTFVDEIKTTYRNLGKMTEPEAVHLAQARCYAYMYMREHGLGWMYVRMTYVNLDSEDIHYFYERVERNQITEWFDDLMREYGKWAAFTSNWISQRTDSIRTLPFPFAYREGQKELAADVYRTIVHGRKLFLEAPTGTGKTIATLFPSIKAMGEGKAQKIFYLTAKSVGSRVAEDTLEICRSKGLKFKDVCLTAKEKVCVLDRPECNPDACPRAKGHFDRINAAIYDLLTTADNFSRTTIQEYAEKHNVCPFEMSLDMSLFADCVICDYNYVFDPHAYLRRFFAEDAARGNYIFLVDEAHNLVDRGRDMYSAAFSLRELNAMSHLLSSKLPTIAEECDRCAAKLSAVRRSMQGEDMAEFSLSSEVYLAFSSEVGILFSTLTEYLERERKKARRRKRKPSKQARELQDQILNFYFDVSHFELISDLFDDHYRIYADSREKDFRMHLACMDPGTNLSFCMDRAVSTILFSATLLPIQYYKQLLGGKPEDYEVYAHSVFDPERRAVIIADDVTSRYSVRGDDMYQKIASAIAASVSGKDGNYMVFFPSYAFLNAVAEIYEKKFCDPERVTLLRQESGMSEEKRKEFLARFEESSDDHTLIGFCVLGGIFSEGIDLRKDSLIGAVIVGTGVPQICGERELLKKYFDANGENGYNYAYRYPGMNKVLQAAGRVIRTQEDLGVVVLLDDRFLMPAYRFLFPREWREFSVVPADEIGRCVDNFWNEWL